MPKCEMCSSHAEVIVEWCNPHTGPQSHKVCDPCGHIIWDEISQTATEAHYTFTIRSILEDWGELVELVYYTSLLKKRPLTGSGGSNPSLAAIHSVMCLSWIWKNTARRCWFDSNSMWLIFTMDLWYKFNIHPLLRVWYRGMIPIKPTI